MFLKMMSIYFLSIIIELSMTHSREWLADSIRHTRLCSQPCLMKKSKILANACRNTQFNICLKWNIIFLSWHELFTIYFTGTIKAKKAVYQILIDLNVPHSVTYLCGCLLFELLSSLASLANKNNDRCFILSRHDICTKLVSSFTQVWIKKIIQPSNVLKHCVRRWKIGYP